MKYNVNAARYPLVSGLVRAFSIDYRTLALCRALLGSIIIVDLALRSRDFTAFFTDQGIVTRKQAAQWYGDGTWSLYFINGSEVFAAAMVGIAVFAAFCLVVGYRTRLATIVSWIMLVSLHHRTAILSAGAEDLLRVLVFWAMFLPLGARCSIDAALEKNTPYPAESHFSIATIAMLLQAMYVYWVGALLKTDPAWTADYTAVYYALSAEHYSTALGLWVAANFAGILPWLTRFVYVIELYGPLLMLSPVLLLWFRLPAMLLLICMHIGFVLLLNVGHFPFISIISLLLFTPPEFWHSIKKRFSDKRSQGITVFYDEGCTFCLKTVLILKQLLILPGIKIEPAQQHPAARELLERHDSWVVEQKDGHYLLEWEALGWLVGRSPWCSWLKYPMRALQVGGIGNRLYHLIGNSRGSLSRISAKVLPWREYKQLPLANGISQTVVAILAIFVLYINMLPLFPEYLPLETQRSKNITYSLGLWQKWNMFAPGPVTWTQWPVYRGQTKDGRIVDIFREEWGDPGDAKPAHILADYKNYRWRKYNSRLYLKKYGYLRKNFVLLKCSQWNTKIRPDAEHLVFIDLQMANERTELNSDLEETNVEDMGIFGCD